MSGLELPGLLVGVVPVAYKVAVEAWKALDDTLSFPNDAEDLSIRLETAKAHLGIWAREAGLTQGELVEAFRPLEELIARTLKRISDLVLEIERQGSKYGLGREDGDTVQARNSNAMIMQMRRSLHSVVTGLDGRTKFASRVEAEAGSVHSAEVAFRDVKASNRVRWAIRDRQKFQEFVRMLEKHVSGLQGFALGYEKKRIQQETTRFVLDIIRGTNEKTALSQLSHSRTNESEESLDMDLMSSLAQWKAISLARAQTLPKTMADTQDWTLLGSGPEDRSRARFLKRGEINPDAAYLFEKKEYDPNISDDLKDLLRERIRQLVTLLGGPRAPRHLHTLKALGHLDDPDYHCWWIVFRFPLSPLDHLTPGAEPLSLRALYSLPQKPALEIRYKLAKRLVDAFAQLYGSDWMHKGITSKNIIFKQTFASEKFKSFKFVESALIQGFNYSRQLTQAQTIDRGKVLHDLEAAIYRHPAYQGDAATGYQIHYDIYSLGLVLFEIAIWGPLLDIMAAKFRPGKEPSVSLSPDMRYFHEVEARELLRRVDLRVENELAYRVGTRYKDVVQWCLHLQTPVSPVEFYNTAAIPLEELCN